jgi:ubiquinone/menaquinone biosynthesis C-methylase UbiE
MPDVTAELPWYLRDVYTWAYITPRMVRLLDRNWVVQTILWGNAQKLIDAALAHVLPGERVMQPAAVYGDFSRQVASIAGHLTLRDVAPVQLSNAERKLAGRPNVRLERHDATMPADERFDSVTCFFLLHEVPDAEKHSVVQMMLRQVEPGGRAIFVDYHKAHRLHPLGPLMWLVYRTLEPFAFGMWRYEIEEMAGELGANFRWSKRTLFGGLYQVVVANSLA